MLFKIKNRYIASLCYLAILGLMVWFGFNKRQVVSTPAAQIEQILQAMQARKIAANHAATVAQEGTCSICLEQADYWLPCGHHFHLTCIKQWLQTTMSCPNCRRHLVE